MFYLLKEIPNLLAQFKNLHDKKQLNTKKAALQKRLPFKQKTDFFDYIRSMLRLTNLFKASPLSILFERSAKSIN